MMNELVFAAVLIVSPGNAPTNRFVVPQESMMDCKLVARLWSAYWPNSKFMCVPSSKQEILEIPDGIWFPEEIGPHNKKS